MRRKLLKKCVSIILSTIMLFGCVPTMFAVSIDNEFSDGYEYGAVLVSVKPNAPSIEQLLPGFEIESSRLITPGSNTQYVLYVKFVEKTKEIVWKAIEVLKGNRFVKIAEPNYYYEIDSVDDPIFENPTEQTEPTEATNQTEPIETTEFVMGTEDTQTNFVKGDADGDGELSVKDATCIQMYLANFMSEQNIDCFAANVSGTGTVTVNDATMIQIKLAGLLNDW